MSLDADLKTFLPSDVRFARADPQRAYPLLPQEQGVVAKAILKRRQAFSAGRHAAREALGLGEVAIPVGEKRAPIWPEGHCGSISHSDTLCLAVAASTDRYLSLGIDVEENTPLKESLRPAILHPDERLVSGEEAIAIFSRKEALFKLLYPITGVWFGFQDAVSDGDHLILQRDLGSFLKGWRMAVPSLQASGHVISFCALKEMPA